MNVGNIKSGLKNETIFHFKTSKFENFIHFHEVDRNLGMIDSVIGVKIFVRHSPEK